MIEALVSGKLHAQPMQKIAKTGKPFVVARVRAHAGDSDVFVNVIAFSPAACEALLALGEGDAVALWPARSRPRPGSTKTARPGRPLTWWPARF